VFPIFQGDASSRPSRNSRELIGIKGPSAKARWGGLIAILALSILTGGWLLRRKAAPEGTVYQQARLFENVVGSIQSHYIDSIGEGDLYQTAAKALVASLHDPYAELLTRETYRQYQRSVGSSLLLLVKSTASLRAIRTLDGPSPAQLVALRSQLSGGAERLERMYAPEYLRDVHERLVGAWRFAENAARVRFEAISNADATAAWEASSSAAGALMMLARVQQELTILLSPPRLQ